MANAALDLPRDAVVHQRHAGGEERERPGGTRQRLDHRGKHPRNRQAGGPPDEAEENADQDRMHGEQTARRR